MNLEEILQWETGIYQLEETDLVQAGPNGIANRQAKELANRTGWLRKELYKLSQFRDLITVSSNATLTKDQKGFLFTVTTAEIEITLPDLSGIDKGTIYAFAALAIPGKPAKIKGNGALINYFDGPKQQIYLHGNEGIWLVADGGQWQIANPTGSISLYGVGNPIYGYKVQPNTVIRNGQLLNRDEYPRLWEWVQTLPPQTLLNDLTWNSHINYMGCFSTGNGSTNFRVPDDRAMFERALDLGRGIDLDRPYNYPGGYEADEIKEHDHATNRPRTDQVGARYEQNTMDGGGDRGLYSGDIVRTGKSGGRETRPINTGKIPLLTF